MTTDTLLTGFQVTSDIISDVTATATTTDTDVVTTTDVTISDVYKTVGLIS